MAHERSESFSEQFGAYVRGIPLRQAVAQITPTQVEDLRTTAAVVLDDGRVPAGTAVIPVRAALFKPAGDAFTVPNGTNFKLRWTGIVSQDLCHLEVDPVTMGAGNGLDQAGEFACLFSGPSFSLTGLAGALVTTNPNIVAEGLGLELYNAHSTTDITGALVGLTVWVWYHLVPVRS